MKDLLLKQFLFFTKKDQLSPDRQKELIDSFREPKNDHDRCLMHYKCSVSGSGRFSRLVLDLFGFFAVPFFLVVYAVNMLSVRKNKYDGALFVCAKNRIGMSYGYEDRFPKELISEYKRIKVLKLDSFPGLFTGVLGRDVLRVWLPFALRHPLEGFINFRALLNLTNFYRLIHIYEPKALINFRAELNPTSSLVTLMCEKEGIEYINFMHGEVMTDISAAFVRFSRFYVWDEHYIDVFGWGRAPKEQFRVYLPSMYQKDKAEAPGEYYMTYVFCGSEKDHTDSNAKLVCDILKEFVKRGRRCKVRPHPRWSDMQQINDVFSGSGVDIEIPREVSVADSINSSSYVAGTFSSVLTEAYYSGRSVVIDDISDSKLTEELKKRKYFLIEKDYTPLSELVDHIDGQE